MSDPIDFQPMQQASQQSQPIDFQPMQVPQQSQVPQQEGPIEQGADYINSAGGGIAKGLANIPQAIGDIPISLLGALHAISPETANKLYNANQENADLLRPSFGSIPQNAMYQHPDVAKAGEIGADAAGLTLGMSGVGSAFAGLPRAAGVLSRMGAMGALNASTATPENKQDAFATGALTSPIFDAAGGAIGSLSKTAQGVEDINKTLATTTKPNIAKAYSVIQNLPFTDTDKSALTNISNKVTSLLQTPNLSPIQQRLLGNLQGSLTNASSHAEVLQTLQNAGLKDTSKYFQGLKASPPVYQAFQGIKSDLENVLNTAAIKNSVGGALQKAQQLVQQAKVTGKVFRGMNADLANFSFKTANKQLGMSIDDLPQLAAFAKTKETLQGLQKITDSLAKEYHPGGLVVRGVGGAVGYGLASKGEPNSHTAGLTGMMAGLIGAPYLFNLMKNYAVTPEGQTLLKSLAKPGIKQEMIRNVTKAMILQGVSGLINTNHTDANDENDVPGLLNGGQ